MADGDVKYRFFADAQAAERAIGSLEKKYESLENKIQQVSKSSKKGSSEGIGGLHKLAESAVTAMAGYMSLNAVVGAGTVAWQKYRLSVEQNIAAQEKLREVQAAGVVQMGLVGGGQRLKEFAQSVPGVLPLQVQAAFEGVQAGQPLVPVAQQERLARAVSGMAPALAPVNAAGVLQDTSKLQEFGEVVGTLSQFAKGKNVGDLMDLAVAVQGSVGMGNLGQLKSGGFERSIDKMMGRGMSAEQALATASVGIDAGFPAKALLNEKNLAGLDQQKIAALSKTFTDAQTNDSARRLVNDVFAVNKPAFVNQASAVAGLQTGAAGATESEAWDIMQQQRWNRSKGFLQSAMNLAREPMEDTGFYMMKAVGMDTGARQALAEHALAEMQKTNKLLEEQSTLVRQQQQHNRPPIRRDAQGE